MTSFRKGIRMHNAGLGGVYIIPVAGNVTVNP